MTKCPLYSCKVDESKSMELRNLVFRRIPVCFCTRHSQNHLILRYPQLNKTYMRHEDIIWFDISMNDTSIMNVVQCS